VTCRLACLAALVALLAVVAPRPASAQFDTARRLELGSRPDLPVEVEADRISYDRKTGRYVLEGNVVARQGDLLLSAERVELVPDADTAEAAGQVVLQAGSDRLTARRVRLDLGDRTGRIEGGSLFIAEDHVTVEGTTIEKTGETTYRMDGVRFSSCLCGEGAPTWSITGRRLRLAVGGFAFVQWPAFRIKGVPVLLLPYGVFPIRTERTTGLLLPRVTQSNIDGFGVELPLFITLGRSMDATLGVNYLSKRGMRYNGEYRYALSETTTGIWQGSYVDDRIEDRDRGDVRIRHRQRLPGRVELRADLNAVSDPDFPVDFGEDIEVTSLRELESRVLVGRRWDDVSLSGRFSVFRSLVEERPSNTIVQLLPQATVSVPPTRLERTPLFGAAEASGTYFFRERGTRGQRLDVFPRLVLPVSLGPAATVTAQAGFRSTLYRTEEPRDEADRQLPFVGLDIKSVLGRVYDVEIADARRLYHTIEPEVSYAFIPTVGQEENPLFDRSDRVPRVSRITYALSTRLFARFAEEVGPPAPPGPPAAAPGGAPDAPRRAPSPPVLVPPTARPVPPGPTGPAREVARLLVQQSYDFGGIEGTSEERLRVGDVPAPAEVLGGQREPLSDVTARLELRPFERILFDIETAYDPNARAADLLGIRSELEDERGVRLRLDYRLLRDEGAEPDIEQVNGDLRVRVGRSLDLSWGARYLVRDDRVVETGYGLAYRSRCDCWAIDVRAFDRIRPDERRIEVLFTLVGLGAFGTPAERGALFAE
jgi:LPS-assembly protein